MGAPGAHQAAIANAIKAFGVLVELTPEEFEKLVRKVEEPLVVHAEGGVFSTKHRYLMGHKGLAFYTVSGREISLPIQLAVVEARKISIPSSI